MERKIETKVIISQESGSVLELRTPDIIDFHSTESVAAYCGSFELTLKSQKKENRDVIQPKAEMQIWVGEKEGDLHKLMAGYIDEIVTEKKQDMDEVLKISGRSYDSLLVDTKISGNMVFEEGYSDVIRQLLKNTPFKEGKVEDSTGRGVLFFRNISVMEVIRNITEENGWIFNLDHDKNYHYFKNRPQEVAKTLEAEDIKSYRIVEK